MFASDKVWVVRPRLFSPRQKSHHEKLITADRTVPFLGARTRKWGKLFCFDVAIHIGELLEVGRQVISCLQVIWRPNSHRTHLHFLPVWQNGTKPGLGCQIIIKKSIKAKNDNFFLCTVFLLVEGDRKNWVWLPDIELTARTSQVKVKSHHEMSALQQDIENPNRSFFELRHELLSLVPSHIV